MRDYDGSIIVLPSYQQPDPAGPLLFVGLEVYKNGLTSPEDGVVHCASCSNTSADVRMYWSYPLHVREGMEGTMGSCQYCNDLVFEAITGPDPFVVTWPGEPIGNEPAPVFLAGNIGNDWLAQEKEVQDARHR